MQFCLDASGTPQRALIFLSAALFDSIQDVFEDSDIVSKPGALAEEQEAEGGESAFVVDLQFARLYLAHSPRVGAVGQQTFVRTKVQRRADFQLQSRRTLQQPVDDVGRVLEMR